jgi:methionyl-tRNA formyltransferase
MGQMTADSRRLRVVLLTSDTADDTMARALSAEPAVDLVGTLAAPLPRPRTLRRRAKAFYRYHGPSGVLRLPVRLLGRLWRKVAGGPKEGAARDSLPHQLLASFHDEQGLTTIRGLDPDVIVVDGTYILPPSVFGLAKLATLNLHCGKLPDYKGAPPVFWELYNDEAEVGVTVHGVTAGVDAGPIYGQRLFPLPRRIAGDPLDFVRAMWLEVLRPAGIALMADTIREIASGRARPQPQPQLDRPAYRRPDHRTARQLRTLLARRGRLENGS